MAEVTPGDRYAPDWYRLNGDWYCASPADIDMYPSNVEVIDTVLALGGRVDTTVDIGAHAGFTAIPAARRGATVWAFEANPWTAACLMWAVVKNGLTDRVRPFHAAVCPGPVRFAEVRSGRLVSGMAGLVQARDQPVVGRATTVDFETVLNAAGHVDFLKLDIEGGEHELLPSVPAAAWKEVDWFHLETHDVEQARWHAPGARNIDWEKLIRGVGFERVTPALWRRK